MSLENQDHYEVLGVDENSDRITILKAFKAKAMMFHPDKNPSHEAKNKFAAIEYAKMVLTDPEKAAEFHKKKSRQKKEEMHRIRREMVKQKINKRVYVQPAPTLKSNHSVICDGFWDSKMPTYSFTYLSKEQLMSYIKKEPEIRPVKVLKTDTPFAPVIELYSIRDIKNKYRFIPPNFI